VWARFELQEGSESSRYPADAILDDQFTHWRTSWVVDVRNNLPTNISDDQDERALPHGFTS